MTQPSGYVSAEISAKSSRKLFIFSIWKTIFWTKVSKNVSFNFGNRSTGTASKPAAMYSLVRSLRKLLILILYKKNIWHHGISQRFRFANNWHVQTCSASFKAEISVRSPQELFIYIIKNIYFPDQSVQITFYLVLKTDRLETCLGEWLGVGDFG